MAAGADVVLPLETTDVDALAAALAAHGPFDVVLDPVFGVPATAAARELAPGGRLVNLGGASGDTAVFSSASLRSKAAAVLGYTNNALSAAQRREALTSVLEHAAAGRIHLDFEECHLRDVEATWSRVVDGTAASRRVLLP
jgi:NADPH:quinone reductase-like Zn-dependent oxidoreductase